jgi:predicted flap endonuclease-1-like 5' DNA nuclease
MTYLLLQTFLLLLSAYFLGAFLACLMKRMITRRAELAAAVPRATLPPAAVRANVPVVATKPRSIDPVQPKIDILPRPEPKAAPVQTKLDTSRFDRALAIPDPNEGMPRKSIVEIRPAILKSPTGPALPFKPKPPAPVVQAQPAPQPKQAPVVAPVQVQPAPAPAAPVQKPTSVPSMGSTQSAGTAAATASAAAAAAVAAAQAAASAAVARPIAQAPAPSQAPKSAQSPAPAAPVQPAPAKPVAAAPQPVAPPMTGGDDLQRIRAIDADTEKRLQSIGVRRFDDIARWTPADINRVNQSLGLTGRIDREQWIEQAQILAKGGETYYSRNRAAAVRGDAPTPAQPQAAPSAQMTVAAATAAAAAAATPKPAAAVPQQQQPAATPQAPAQTPAQSSSIASSQSNPAAPQGRSVAEMAAAAAAAIAAASASVTRGIRPIEPISPLSRANPNISMPAKLSDAIKDKEKDVKAASPAPAPAPATTAPKTARAKDAVDDLKRVRGIGVLIEKRLNALGVNTYDDIANWTSADIDRISQTLDFKGRIERENWVEQARILSSGGQTEFSRRVDRGDVETSKDS